MNIDFNDIQGVSLNNKNELAIFLKSMSGTFPSPSIILKGKELQPFLSLYRRYLLGEKDPRDRIIKGIDDQKNGHYSLEAEKAAIYESMKMAEQKTIKTMTPAVTQFLLKIFTIISEIEKYQETSLMLFAEIKKVLPEIQNDWEVRDVDNLSETLKGISDSIKGLSRVKKHMNLVMDSWM